MYYVQEDWAYIYLENRSNKLIFTREDLVIQYQSRGGMHQQDVHVAQTFPVPFLERAGAESDESAGGKRIPHRAAHSETPNSENLPVTEKYHNNSKTYLAGHRVMTSVTYQWHTTAWLYLQCRMVWVLSGSAGRNA